MDLSRSSPTRFIFFKRQGTASTHHLKFALCLALVLQCALVAPGQSNQAGTLPPRATGFITVQLPNTRDMEPEVREHITSAWNALAAATKDSATTTEALGLAYGEMGQALQAYSLVGPAKECYLNATRLAPKDFRWAYLLGKLYEQDGDAQSAINYYNTARSIRPDYLPLLVNLGSLYLQLNDLEMAEDYFKQAQKADEASAAPQYWLGQVALSKRDYAAAVGYFEKALKLVPEANRLHYALAMAYRGLGNVEQARSHLALSGPVGVRVPDPLVDGLQDLARGARLHLIRGKTALDARRFSEAADEFRKALVQQPNSIPAHLNLGAALTQMGDQRGAVEQFEETLRLDANHANAHYNLGLLLAQMNQHEQSIKHLRSAISLEPTDNNARYLLAQELANTRHPDEAAAELSKVIQSDPDNEGALIALVNILLAGRQYSQALAALEKGHSQFPQKGLTAVTLAYLLATSPQLDLRDGKRALELARSAYEATGAINHGAIVAMALAELGRCDEAAAWARRLITNAASDRKPDLIEKLKTELNRYENTRPCRPASDVTNIK